MLSWQHNRCLFNVKLVGNCVTYFVAILRAICLTVVVYKHTLLHKSALMMLGALILPGRFVCSVELLTIGNYEKMHGILLILQLLLNCLVFVFPIRLPTEYL